MQRGAAPGEAGHASSGGEPRALVIASILAASALMMAVTGYSFLGGNHQVYLLEPLRRAGLASFEGDWFVSQTLQYHGLFAQVAALLFRLDVARPAFLVIFLALLLAAAWAWWRIVRALGGDVVSFLGAVVLYHLLLGDRALGFYSILQDGQFSAGNVAAVATLVGIAMWMQRRAVPAGIAFGLAGAFHLNYAVVLPGLWLVLLGWELWKPVAVARGPGESRRLAWFIASILALLPSIANIAFALPAKLRQREMMPLDRFVDLYVRLRHPHHYDPLAWPWWVWAAFLAPIPLAVFAWRSNSPRSAQRSVEAPSASWRAAARIWLVLMAMQIFALLAAGLFWTTETFIQLSLWRFSSHAKLLAASAIAVWIVTSVNLTSGGLVRTTPRILACLLLTGPLVALAYWALLRLRGAGDALIETGLMLPAAAGALVVIWLVAVLPLLRARDTRQPSRAPSAALALFYSAAYFLAITIAGATGYLSAPAQPPADETIRAAAEWAEQNTPPQSLFLLPPDGSAFGVHALRGQVVSFKMVPQLSGELAEWDRRLRDVLDVPDLSIFAGGWTGFFKTREAMRRRYDELPPQHLFDVARRYGARYVFRSAADQTVPEAAIVWRGDDGAVLYDPHLLPSDGQRIQP